MLAIALPSCLLQGSTRQRWKTNGSLPPPHSMQHSHTKTCQEEQANAFPTSKPHIVNSTTHTRSSNKPETYLFFPFLNSKTLFKQNDKYTIHNTYESSQLFVLSTGSEVVCKTKFHSHWGRHELTVRAWWECRPLTDIKHCWQVGSSSETTPVTYRGNFQTRIQKESSLKIIQKYRKQKQKIPLLMCLFLSFPKQYWNFVTLFMNKKWSLWWKMNV